VLLLLHLALHHLAQCTVDPGLITAPVLLEPGQYVGIEPQRDRLFEWPVEIHVLDGERLLIGFFSGGLQAEGLAASTSRTGAGVLRAADGSSGALGLATNRRIIAF